MTAIPEQLLQDIAATVAQRFAASGSESHQPRSGYVLVVLSGEPQAGDDLLAGLERIDGGALALPDRPSSAATVAGAKALAPALSIAADGVTDVDGLVGRASRVVAPAMDLALASRVASLQADTPGARAILRALFGGTRVEASLDVHDFDVSERAPEGTRRAVASVESRLRELGIELRRAERAGGSPEIPHHITPSGAYGAGWAHPSQDRFTLPASVNEFVDFLERKGCSIEPGKPCVDCGACETRGF